MAQSLKIHKGNQAFKRKYFTLENTLVTRFSLYILPLPKPSDLVQSQLSYLLKVKVHTISIKYL